MKDLFMGKIKESFNPISVATPNEVFAEAVRQFQKAYLAQYNEPYRWGRIYVDVLGGEFFGAMTEEGKYVFKPEDCYEMKSESATNAGHVA
jgi:hypothetical protein